MGRGGEGRDMEESKEGREVDVEAPGGLEGH